MNNRKETLRNTIIMFVPVMPPSIYIVYILGESFPLFLVPLIIYLFTTIRLAKRISKKDAIVYPFVQYPFIILLYFIAPMRELGLEWILMFPFLFSVNLGMGYYYFRYVKNKRWFKNVLFLLATLIVTTVLFFGL